MWNDHPGTAPCFCGAFRTRRRLRQGCESPRLTSHLRLVADYPPKRGNPTAPCEKNDNPTHAGPLVVMRSALSHLGSRTAPSGRVSSSLDKGRTECWTEYWIIGPLTWRGSRIHYLCFQGTQVSPDRGCKPILAENCVAIAIGINPMSSPCNHVSLGPRDWECG